MEPRCFDRGRFGALSAAPAHQIASTLHPPTTQSAAAPTCRAAGDDSHLNLQPPNLGLGPKEGRDAERAKLTASSIRTISRRDPGRYAILAARHHLSVPFIAAQVAAEEQTDRIWVGLVEAALLHRGGANPIDVCLCAVVEHDSSAGVHVPKRRLEVIAAKSMHNTL